MVQFDAMMTFKGDLYFGKITSDYLDNLPNEIDRPPITDKQIRDYLYFWSTKPRVVSVTESRLQHEKVRPGIKDSFEHVPHVIVDFDKGEIYKLKSTFDRLQNDYGYIPEQAVGLRITDVNAFEMMKLTEKMVTETGSPKT